MNDVDRRVSRLNPVPLDAVEDAAHTPQALALLQRVLDEPASGQMRPPARSWAVRRRRSATRRFSRLPIVAGASVLVLAGTAIGWALTQASSRDTVSVQCLISGSDTIIPAITGDPVADCAAQWRRDHGGEPPPLVAYDNGHGGITVVPADQTPPAGATPLPGRALQNVAIVQAQQALDDLIHGLNSGCFDNATAVEETTRILTRFGMGDWAVQPAPPSDVPAASGEQAPRERCVGTAIIDAANRTVLLRALGGPLPAQAPYQRLAARLRVLSQECLPLDVMARRVRSIADDLGLSEARKEYQLTEITEKDAPCTTIVETVGGTIFLILRGPAASE